MEKYIEMLKKSPLFAGMDGGQIDAVVDCMRGYVKHFEKDAVLMREGDEAHYIGVVLSGELELSKTDFHGNSNIVTTLLPAEMFAESAAFATRPVPVDVVCRADSVVLCLPPDALFEKDLCAYRSALLQNLLCVLSQKNVRLTDKIDILTKRSIREKLLAFLLAESRRKKSSTFAVDYTRGQMADYLSVDRSALSRELSKMQDEGLISYDGKAFKIHTES